MTPRLRQVAAVALVLMLAPATADAQFGKITKKVKRAFDTFTPWTPEQEEEIGRAGAAKMIAVLGLYNEPGLTEYVNLVGNTVARQGERSLHYRFAVLNTPVVNAFALPGGYIFVTRGALATMKNEAELAGTLAHEVAHVDGRHLEKAVRKKKAAAAVAKTPEPAAIEKLPDAKVVLVVGDFIAGSLGEGLVAAFETTPERIAASSGGASVYAVRSQPWNGSSGAFTAKAARNPRNTQSFELVPISESANVPCEIPKATIDASIRREPAIV